MAKIKAKLKEWLAMKTEDCKTISPLFSYELDRKLSIVEKIRVRLHLFTCGACLNYVTNLNFMRRVFRSQEENLENENTEIRLSAEAKERIKQKLI